MKSNTLDLWQEMVNNPTEGYTEFLSKEKDFLLKNVKKDSVILEIGCGLGRIMEILSPYVRKIIGIDNIEGTIEKCKNNLKNFNNIEIFLEDAEEMHFEDKFFDVITISGLTFCNFGETKIKILSEIKRILKDNGIFIFGIYNENALDERMVYYKKYFVENFEVDGKGTAIFGENYVSEQFNEEEIRKILDEASFEILELIKGKIFYLIKAKKKLK